MGATDLLLVSEFFDVEAGEISPFNLLIALIGFLAGFAIAVFGAQEGSLKIIAIGLTFTIAIPATIVFTGFSLVTGRSSLGQGSLAFWLANLPWILPGAIAGAFSVFSSPTGSYLSVLGNTPLYIRLFANVVIAPINESFLFIGLAVIGFWTLKETVQSNKVAIGLLVTLLGVGFAFLHGARTVAFLLLASTFMAVTILGILGEGTGTWDIPFVDVTLAGAIGAHFANNVAASGGYVTVAEGLLAAPEPYSYLSLVVVGFFGLTLFLAVTEVISWVSKAVN